MALVVCDHFIRKRSLNIFGSFENLTIFFNIRSAPYVLYVILSFYSSIFAYFVLLCINFFSHLMFNIISD